MHDEEGSTETTTPTSKDRPTALELFWPMDGWMDGWPSACRSGEVFFLKLAATHTHTSLHTQRRLGALEGVEGRTA